MLAGFNPHQQVLGPKDPYCCSLADFWGLQLPENIAFYLKIACPGEPPNAQPVLPFAFLPQAWGEHSLKQPLPNHMAGLQVSSCQAEGLAPWPLRGEENCPNAHSLPAFA